MHPLRSRWTAIGLLPTTLALSSLACSSGGSSHGGTDAGKTNSSGGKGGASGKGGTTSASSGGASQTVDAGQPGLIHVSGTPDTSVSTKLPPLPALTNVTASAVYKDVSIKFDPIDGARDYRVYALPDDKDVSFDDSGHVTVQNATYRCAGDRQAPAQTLDNAPLVKSGYMKTLVDNVDVNGYTRQLADATLGYVYVTPGAGRTPVYAMGNPAATADNDCYFQRWGASRSKVYVTSDATHADLLTKKWRDDGIVFYVPSAAGSNTASVYTTSDDKNTYYFTDGPEAAVRNKNGPSTVAFQVLTAAAGDDTKPLMRAFYQNYCGLAHDELVAGQAWFDRIRLQGDQQPLFDLHWAGLQQETTLVVEALEDGCPYPGFIAPKSGPSFAGGFGNTLPPWLTLDDVRKASATGEVYVNGQHDTTASPRPIARSFVKISPGPKPDLDWFTSFGDTVALTPATTEACGYSDCWQQFRQSTPLGDLGFLLVETPRWGYVQQLGEFWTAYDDVGADVNGKYRLTPSPKAQMSASTFIHATMTVDAFTTNRRYPQIMISDQDVPVQWNMVNGKTLVFQTFIAWPNEYELEACDHQLWDVNAQCPAFDLYHLYDPNDSTKIVSLAPNAEVGEHVGMDRMTRFDVYASTQRAYLFLDDEPYGCVALPSSGKGVPNAGPVTVTFGDVLYHSDADNGLFAYTSAHLQLETRRHWDNLGYKSGVPAPTWDENRFPCVTRQFQQ
jgi:hypothetical protein